MTVFVNPGTEPRPGTEGNAVEAMRMLLADLDREGTTFSRTPDKDTEGYYAFTVSEGDPAVRVDMPGCDPHVTAKGEAWTSPRLYVDGGSWLWGYALGFVDDALSGR